MKIECRHCGYKQEKDYIPARCGYCGKLDTMRPSVTATSVLRSVR